MCRVASTSEKLALDHREDVEVPSGLRDVDLSITLSIVG